MAKVVCSKCGLTGYSKCPICRNIFADTDDLDMAGLGLLELRRGTNDYGKLNGKDELQLVWTYMLYEDQHLSNEERAAGQEGLMLDKLKDRLERLAKAPWEDIRKALCRHHWVFAPGERSSIGCGHGPQESEEQTHGNDV
jgi:hypothetical protein